MLLFKRMTFSALVLAAATFAATFAGGSGTKADPYRIANADQFFAFAALVNSGETGISGMLTADIDLNDTSDFDDWGAVVPERVWTPIGSAMAPYQGFFDGKNHSVNGVFIDTALTVSLAGGFADSSIGFFSQIGVSGEVRNLKFRSAFVSVNVKTDTAGETSLNAELFRTGVNGGIAVGKNSGIVKNISILSGKLLGFSVQFYRVGAIAGRNEGMLYDCVNYAEIYIRRGVDSDVWVDVGGIVGNDAGDVGNCINYGNVTSENTAGGIAGLLTKEGHLFNCANYGIVTSQNSLHAYIGGVVGKANSGAIENVLNRGAVSVFFAKSVTAGGLIGEAGKDSAVVVRNSYTAAASITIDSSSSVVNGSVIGNVQTSKVVIDSVYAEARTDGLNLFGKIPGGTTIQDTVQFSSLEMQSQEFTDLLGLSFCYGSSDDYPVLASTTVSTVMFIVQGEVFDVDEVPMNTMYVLPNVKTSGYDFLYWTLEGDSIGVAGDTVKISGDMVFFSKSEAEVAIPVLALPEHSLFRVENQSLVFENIRKGTRVAVFDLRGRMVANFVAQASEARVSLPAPGIYSVRSGTSARLVSVK